MMHLMVLGEIDDFSFVNNVLTKESQIYIYIVLAIRPIITGILDRWPQGEDG